MTRISNLTSVDSRSDWGKISRRQYWKGAKALNISFPDGASQPKMIEICQAAGVTPDQLAKFIPVRVGTPDGSGKVVMVPEDHERKYDERKELHRAEEMERRIASGIKLEEERISADKLKMESEKNAEISALRTEIDEMKKMIAQLLDNAALTSHPAIIIKSSEEPKQKETDPYAMKFMAQRKWLKEHGVDLPKGGNAKELIKQVLEDEQDAA